MAGASGYASLSPLMGQKQITAEYPADTPHNQ
jgi:hypothetical protein